jgi:HAD superfamily hydrolase (TIGR01509 family)
MSAAQRQSIRAVIFDKDGTLHDTEKVFLQAWRLAAEDLDVPDIEATVRDCTGVNLPDTSVYWAKKYPDIPFETYLARRNHHFDEIVRDGVPIKAGAVELLTYLTERGYAVGMATSTPYPTVMEHLARTDMTRFFAPEAIITGDMVKRGKPDPEIFLLAAARLGVEPAACIGVEDSNNGLRAVCAAGMRAVFVPDLTPAAEDVKGSIWRTCGGLTELIPILERSTPWSI